MSYLDIYFASPALYSDDFLEETQDFGLNTGVWPNITKFSILYYIYILREIVCVAIRICMVGQLI